MSVDRLWELAENSGNGFELITPNIRLERDQVLERSSSLADRLSSQFDVAQDEIISIATDEPETVSAPE
jgi:hypothetical protein